MEVYTLDREFRAKDPIDDTQSIIWTERFNAAGDATVVLEDTAENRLKLFPGTFLACTDSKEVVIIETRSMKDGLLTIKGETLTKFLEHRVIRASAYWNMQSQDFENVLPGEMMSGLVRAVCIEGPFVASEFPYFGINGYRQRMHMLYLGMVYSGGDRVTINVPYGPLYSALKTIGETYQIGFRMYLESASDQVYVLRFDTYKGRDLTSTGPDPSKLVRFSPTTDSLAGTSVLESVSGYKNVCYAYATQWTTPSYAYGMGEAFAPGLNPNVTDFDRRVMMIFVDDIAIPEGYPTQDAFGRPPGDPPPGYILPALNARARDALANNNYTRLVDGEVVPQGQFQFGRDFLVGDIVELGDMEYAPAQKARITEYIRTKDQDGERAYPTVTVLD